jgi:hypothetical protein
MRLNHFMCAGAIIALLSMLGPVESKPPVKDQPAKEAPAAKPMFDCICIAAKFKNYEGDKPKDYIEFKSITDENLQAQLKTLRKDWGFNYFEMRRTGSANAVLKETTEFRLDEKQDYYCKFTVSKIEQRVDGTKQTHTYYTFTAVIVKRTKNDKGASVDTPQSTLTKTLESGQYIVSFVYKNFYPEGVRDLVFAFKITN